MTLVLGDDVDWTDPVRAGQANTHVLIVGVSHYETFSKGGGTVGDVALESLTSPVPSATALAKWYVDQYAYPNAPLGSVELLLSAKRPTTFAGKEIEAATYDNFADAALRWASRGSNQSSRLIFVFCGHGFGHEGDSSLLFADFDGRRRDCWNSALDLREFIAGLEETAAVEQLFFIDACRKPHPAHLRPNSTIGNTPIQLRLAEPRPGLPRRNAPTFFSTGADELAHAPIGGLSVFTTAFLRAMKGMAAGDDVGYWRVHSFNMLYAMDHVSQRLTQQGFPNAQQPQGTESRMFEFHRLPKPPISPVYIQRSDNGASGDAHIRYRKGGKTVTKRSQADTPELEVELPLGAYTFELIDDDDRVIRRIDDRSYPAFRTVAL